MEAGEPHNSPVYLGKSMVDDTGLEPVTPGM